MEMTGAEARAALADVRLRDGAMSDDADRGVAVDETMLKAIVAFSIDITSMVGKFKASQNRVATDREGLRQGLAEDGLTQAEVAALAREPQA